MNEKNPVPNRIHFCDLTDPQSRFMALKASTAYHNYEMCIPPVFTADRLKTVVPWEYQDMIPNETLFAVRGKMKM